MLWQRGTLAKRQDKTVTIGFWLANFSLFVFWLALVGAGLLRGTAGEVSFFETSEAIRPYLLAFLAAGGGLLVGLWLVILPALAIFARILKRPAGET